MTCRGRVRWSIADVWIGLVLALVSALAVNWAYTQEHEAAASMPPLSFRQPVVSVRHLLGNRQWVIGFTTEVAAWVVYVVALRLAPLSLVQAVSASGIAVLALLGVRGHPSRLARHEQLAVVFAVLGLLLLAVSLVGTTPVSHPPDGLPAIVWLGASAAIAVSLMVFRFGMPRAAELGIAAGLFFAAGDVSAKLVSFGGVWFATLLPLVVCYALGTSVLQGAFQHGSALTAAGLATLVTNAVPIAAGFVLFDEALPHGAGGALQVAAFGSIVAGAALLGHAAAARPEEAENPVVVPV
jgi:hypothetical protein